MAVQIRNEHDDYDDLDQSSDPEPARGQGGQFRKGRSGNPNGRPRKPKIPPTDTLSAALVQILGEKVTVTYGGKKQKVPRHQVLAMKMVTGTMNAPLLIQAKIFAMWQKEGIIDAAKDTQAYVDELKEVNAPPTWTPELEEQYKLIEGEYEGPYDEPVCVKCAACGVDVDLATDTEDEYRSD